MLIRKQNVKNDFSIHLLRLSITSTKAIGPQYLSIFDGVTDTRTREWYRCFRYLLMLQT